MVLAKLKDMMRRKKETKTTKTAKTARKPMAIKKKTKYLSLDLGSHSIKGVVGSADENRIIVEQFFEELLPEGLYQNGRVRDQGEFKNFLAMILSNHKIKIKNVILTIDTSELIKREIVLPDIEDMDVEEAISYEIGDYLPIDIPSYVLQPRVMEHYVEEGQKRQKVLVAALPKEIAETLFFVLRDAGLTPEVLDIHSNAIEKIFTPAYMGSLYQANGSSVFVDLGHKISNITILENGEYQFGRILRFGGDNLEVAIRSSGYDMNDELKEKIYGKSMLDYVDTSLDTYAMMAGNEEEMMARVLFSQLSSWADDIEKVISYYGSQNLNRHIERIFLYGGSSRFRDLDRFLERRLGIPAVLLDRLDAVTFPPNKSVELFKYMNALSALIGR